jgi:hypothetical protein
MGAIPGGRGLGPAKTVHGAVEEETEKDEADWSSQAKCVRKEDDGW